MFVFNHYFTKIMLFLGLSFICEFLFILFGLNSDVINNWKLVRFYRKASAEIKEAS